MNVLLDFFLGFDGLTAYLIIFAVLLACGLGVPIPEDITLIGAGVLSYYGRADVYLMIVVGLVGVLLGDFTIYFLGKKWGLRLAQHRIFARLLSPKQIASASEMFQKRGLKLLFAARFMPGFRAPIFFTAGTLQIPLAKMLLYDGSAALISVPAIVYFTFLFGHKIDHVIEVIRQVENGILMVIFAVIGFFILRWWWKKRRHATNH